MRLFLKHNMIFLWTIKNLNYLRFKEQTFLLQLSILVRSNCKLKHEIILECLKEHLKRNSRKTKEESYKAYRKKLELMKKTQYLILIKKTKANLKVWYSQFLFQVILLNNLKMKNKRKWFNPKCLLIRFSLKIEVFSSRDSEKDLRERMKFLI